MVEVKRVKELGSKQDFYLTIFELLKQGNNPQKISKQLNISKQNLNYYLRKIKDKGLINKIGYGVWEINPNSKEIVEHTKIKSKNFIRGHAFIWNIKLPQEIEDFQERLIKLNIEFKLVRKCIPRIYIGNKKVWLGKKSIIVYEPKSFYGTNAIESRKYSAISLIETIKLLENKLKINLKPYMFNPAREHFALIRNDLAIQCNRNNEKIHIEDVNGEWLWVDSSDGVGELETGNNKALVNNIGVQRWWNEMKDTHFEITPTFIQNSLAGLIKVEQMNADNIVKHQKVLDEMLITLKKIQEKLDKI